MNSNDQTNKKIPAAQLERIYKVLTHEAGHCWPAFLQLSDQQEDSEGCKYIDSAQKKKFIPERMIFFPNLTIADQQQAAG